MHSRIIPTDPEKYDAQEGRWRVTTSAYLYEFRAPDNAKLWGMHWHPAGKSHATFPHLHLYPIRPGGHFPTARQTLESAVHWCIEMGAEPQNAQWRTVPSPRGSTSCTDPGPRTRHRRQVAGDAGPYRGEAGCGRSAGSSPRSPQPAPLRLRSAGGRVGRRPIPQGREAPFRRPAQSEMLPRVWGAGAVVRAVSEATAAAAPVRTQSADGPQNGRNRPTAAESDHR